MVPPAVCTYSPVVTSGTESRTEDMQMEKAADRHLLIPVSSLRLSRAAGGIISVDYYTVSDVVIKPNQEAKTRETNRGIIQEEGKESNKKCVCVIKREGEKIEKFIEAGFYDKMCWF